MPAGLAPACPFLEGTAPPSAREPGSLIGTVVFTVACVLAVLLALLLSRSSVQPLPAVLLCIGYSVYAAYQVLAQRGHVAAACFWDICI
mmetsp:Transcript_64696/g.144540  ORF Transcript_64696/g.144540 Transcript_64696/m.144540 type:complete len:89 (-) Transcript_64696:185-451(-)